MYQPPSRTELSVIIGSLVSSGISDAKVVQYSDNEISMEFSVGSERAAAEVSVLLNDFANQNGYSKERIFAIYDQSGFFGKPRKNGEAKNGVPPYYPGSGKVTLFFDAHKVEQPDAKPLTQILQEAIPAILAIQSQTNKQSMHL